MMNEFDLFESGAYAGDPKTPIIVCSGHRGCGALVANQFDARRQHVDFHNNAVGDAPT